MVSRAIEHRALRYTLIAVSAWLYDGIAHSPRGHSVANLRNAIPMIQQAVTTTSLNDGHTFAVFMLCYLSIVRGDLKGIKLHASGFSRILRHCDVLQEDGYPRPDTASLAMVLWRIAIRADTLIGLCGHQAAFPITNAPESCHRQWVRQFDNPERPQTVEWAVSQFILDDLSNRLIHLGLRWTSILRAADRGRVLGMNELNLQVDLTFLIRDFEEWKNRQVLRGAEYRERRQREQHLTTPQIRFLHYEALSFVDEVYAIQLAQYFSFRIQLSLIMYPQIVPYPEERKVFAIEYCRVYAAIGGLRRPGLTGLLVGLFFAALSLVDKSYPLGKCP
jgi:hypothetical protein